MFEKIWPVSVTKSGTTELYFSDNCSGKVHDLAWKLKLDLSLYESPDDFTPEDLGRRIEAQTESEVNNILWAMTKSAYPMLADPDEAKPRVVSDIRLTEKRDLRKETQHKPFKAHYEIKGAAFVTTSIDVNNDQCWLLAKRYLSKHIARQIRDCVLNRA